VATVGTTSSRQDFHLQATAHGGRTDRAGAAEAAPASGDRSPRGRTAGALRRRYFSGVTQRVKDSSPYTKVAQLPDTSRSS